MLPPESVGSAARTAPRPVVEPAQVQADQLLQRATTPYGAVDTAKLRADVGELARTDPGLANATRAAVAERLSPSDLGDFLSDLRDGLSDAWNGVKEVAKKLGQEIEKRIPEPSTAADLTVPPTAADAPGEIRFSGALNSEFGGLWGSSFPGGSALEQGGTLVFDRATNEMRLINIGGNGATPGSFAPDLTITDPDKTGLLGVFHTHPYDDGSTGISFSGADAAYMINNRQNVILAQSGDRQFMLLRTAETPANIDYTATNNAQNARIGELVGNGLSFEDAASQAAQELASRLNLAYYEGQNGVLSRVTP